MYKWSREKGKRANKAAGGWAGGAAHRRFPASFPALGSVCSAQGVPVQLLPAQLLANSSWSHSDSPKGLISMSPFWPRTPESLHEQTITHPLMDRNGQSWTETPIFPNGNVSVVDDKTLLCFFFFFFLFNFIHELKWLWAVTNRFFTVFWTDGCSKNTSILAVSNSLDLPKQRCRLFVRRKEIKSCSHSPDFFFLDY